MISKHGYEVWRGTHFVDSLKDLFYGAYKLKLDIPEIDIMVFGEKLEKHGKFDTENWILTKELHEKNLRSVIGKSRDILTAHQEGRSPVTALSLLNELACLSEKISYKKALYQGFEERSLRNPTYRGVDLEIMAQRVPQCLKILTAAHGQLKKDENNLYDCISGLFRKNLKEMAERFEKKIPRDSEDPWKPAWLLLARYKN